MSITAGLNPLLSGRDNVYLYGLMLGMSARRLRDVYRDVVSFSGLDRFMDEPLTHYSAGMKARLGFSTAAMVDPDILIVDEVLSAGDTAFREKAAAKMRELIGRARAVIVVTHDLRFVESVCTRAVWLEKGRLEFDGPPDAAVRRYRRAAQSSGMGPLPEMPVS
jgi:teichoic acid transport system ATP-binding protein